MYIVYIYYYALNRGHALTHMLTWKYITVAHTKASIEGIPPNDINTGMIWKQMMSIRLITIGYMQYNTRQKER